MDFVPKGDSAKSIADQTFVDTGVGWRHLRAIPALNCHKQAITRFEPETGISSAPAGFSPTDDEVGLLRTPRTHRGAQIALVFGTPILTIEVDEYRSVGNGELGFEDEDMVLCAVLGDFVDE